MAEPAVRSSNEDRIRAALWFAGRGFGVFSVWSANDAGVCRCPKGSACTSPAKHPITPEGFKDATTDPKRIRTLLSAGSEPNYGLVNPDGVFGWDIDGNDISRIKGLESQNGELPRTLRTNTANGFHLFYRWPDAYPRPMHQLYGCVTRWGSGKMSGYVIGPRSVHASGVEYTPGETFEIATFPDAWAAGQQGETITIGQTELPAVGHRHDWLRDKARHYRGFIDDPAVLRAAIMAENAKLEQPKSAEEVDRAIGDVYQRFPLDPPEKQAESVGNKLGDSGLDFLPSAAQDPFPDAPDAVAYDGVLGEVVRDLADGTDASEIGLLGAALAFCGAMIPGQAYFHRMQTSSPFVALVGESSIGRKGTAMMRVSDALSGVWTPQVVSQALLDGLASGEGLVARMHWKQSTFPTEPTVGLVFEEEYATLIAARSREGSTLDPKMRAAFDGSILSNIRSSESKRVLPPYWLAALIAITPSELRERLEAGALGNGSANRWLYLPVVRRQGHGISSVPILDGDLSDHLQAARTTALRDMRPLSVEASVTERLHEYSDWLPTVTTGIATELVRRLGVLAFRIALVHALVENSGRLVTNAHLDRALAVTEYARRGIRWVFGSTIGDRYADLLLRTLQHEGRVSKRTITRELIRDPLKQTAAVDTLLRLDLARLEVEHHPAGRPTTWLVYFQKGGLVPPFYSNGRENTKNVETMEVIHDTNVTSNGTNKETIGND